MSRAVRLVLVLLVTLAAQAFLVDSLPVLGARLDLWIVLAVAGGLAAGPDRGAAIGFVCGLMFDLTHNGPIGLGALIYSVAAFLVGSVQRSMVGHSRLVPILGAAVTAFAAVTTYVALGILLGESAWLTPRMISVILVVTVGAALLTPPAARIMAWTEGEPLGLPAPRGRSGSTRRTSRSGRQARASAPPSRPRARQ